MLIIAGVMAIDVIYQIQMHVRWRLWLSEVSAAGQADPKSAATQAAKPSAGMVEINASLKRRNIFIDPPPKGHGITLTGVMGKMAIFNNRGGQTFSVEEGKSGNGVTVKSIRNYEVEIECGGKCETMKLFGQGARPMMSSPTPMPGPGARPMAGPMPGMPVRGMKQAAMEIPSRLPTTRPNMQNNQGSLDRNTQPCTTMP
jgi:hypothetical protein